MFYFRLSFLVFHPHLDFVMLYLLFLMFLFSVSSIRVTCVANFVNVPVVVRLEGNNAPLGREILAKSGLNIIAAQTLTDAAVESVKAAKANA